MSESINRDRLIQFLANIDQEIANMQSGEGKHRPGTLHFEAGKNSCPVMNRLEVFRETPTTKNLNEFLELAAQDFGAPTADYFRGMSQAIFKSAFVSPKKPVVKAFDVAVKDCFYDLFRTAQIPLTPKQVERIETLSLQLAAVFTRKISEDVSKQVKDQLGALVAGLKAKEKAEAQPEDKD